MAIKNTIYIGIQHFRIFLCQPCRRSCCRRTKDDFHPHLLCQIQEFIIKVVIKYPFIPLYFAPCKFRNSNHLNTIFQHSSQIVTPETLIPVFWIITSPQYQSFAINDLHRFLSFSIIFIYNNICCCRKCKEPYNTLLFFHRTRCQTGHEELRCT